MGLPRNWRMQKSAADQPEADDDGLPIRGPELEEDNLMPPGFPHEDDFQALLCFKCVDSNPWIKQYAGAPGFLPPLFKRGYLPTGGDSRSAKPDDIGIPAITDSKKRRGSDESDSQSNPIKRTRLDEQRPPTEDYKETIPTQKHDSLPPAPHGTFSLFLKEDFRDHICHCPKCYPYLIPHPQLVEEEDIYQPPLSESSGSDAGPGSGARSHGTGSLLERGEAALSSIDRVRAIEGVMVYNHLKDKVKDFLKPYAESGKAVGAEDIKAYFEKLRGDETAIREAGTKPGTADGEGDHRREQSGY